MKFWLWRTHRKYRAKVNHWLYRHTRGILGFPPLTVEQVDAIIRAAYLPELSVFLNTPCPLWEMVKDDR